jgi:hypothetical protein
MDMCYDCKHRGNLKECEETDCPLHECWIIKELYYRIEQNNLKKEK